MINHWWHSAYMRYYLRRSLPVFFITSGIAFLVAFSIPYVVSTFEMTKMVRQMMQNLPPILQGALSDNLEMMTSFAGNVGYSYKHPLLIFTLSFFGVYLPIRFIGMETERGRMEILLTLPVRRSQVMGGFLFLSAAYFAIIGLLLVGGTLLAIRATAEPPIATGLLFKTAYLTVVFYWVIFSASLAATQLWRDSDRALRYVVTPLILLFLLDIILQYLPEWKARLSHYNIFHYYRTQELILQRTDGWHEMTVLVLISIVLLSWSYYHFIHRDIP